MSAQRYDGLMERMEAFSKTLDERARAFKKNGTLSDDHANQLNAITARHNNLRTNIESSMRNKSPWTAIQDEFERDFNELFLEFEQVDANFMKSGNGAAKT